MFVSIKYADNESTLLFKYFFHFKKSLREKTLFKNFFNALVVLVTTIPAPDVPPGMIYYTFLLPGKNDICKA